ncbi:OmpA family protein [Luteolibacter arcticus]|uniref:OmpA family protein n=1 Tax=Luteolibacter arcticus TaxID=1581411 RepID=A0ABT3GHU4_9BACT|nr:OmpA family protein [Luteolibacter arcticus]MCW1923081.1 OmpA family protein [Luteolibacter arcticus]
MKTSSSSLRVFAALTATLLSLPSAYAQEPANPESEPLKDRSTRASKRSEPVEDTTRRASEDSRPVEDEKRPAGERTQPAGKDARPVEDDNSKANERSRNQRDTDEKASPDARKTEDATPRKASPDARRTRDASSDKAGPEAAKVEDSNDDKASPDARETSPKDRRRNAPPAPFKPEKELPPAEANVVRAHEELAQDLHQRKLQIQGRDEARRMVEDILGKESNLSRAEFNRADQSAARRAARADRRPAVEFLRQRLRGQAEVREIPPFFRTAAPAEAAAGEPILPEPYFVHEGRRYVYYPSREDVPAVLLASAELERVSIMPAAEQDAAVFSQRIPLEYRGGDAWVVSYPVVSSSTVTSHDILFLEGSTQFADGHAFDMVMALAEAMLDSELAGSRFAIEGHASAEGTSAENQVLSQLRAEAIVRELVRSGVPADRLIPFGYGESEAHHLADAPENLLRQDRRVVVSRIDAPADR